jgi:septal ring factor EnvC (AmiA/AmiB activator)
MEKKTFDELNKMLKKLERDIRETKQSLISINTSIDKYEKYQYIKVS